MHAEVISIGDELTSGERLDTNSQWLSQRLTELGIRVLFHTTVGDDLAASTQVFRQAIDRADIIISSGGLGPTADDLTREALAAATNTDLVQNEIAVQHIQSIFARRKRPMPELNLVQAQFPRGSRMVHNPNGTAPGIEMDVPRAGRSPAKFFALPGVPAEMFEMWEGTLRPGLVQLLGERRRIIQSKTIKCFGVGESDLEAMLPDLIRRGRQPTVGITVSKATISLRIVAEGANETECVQQIDSTVTTIHSCLGHLIFGEGDEELSHAVIRILAGRDLSLAVAEIGSGGLLAKWLSESDPTTKTFRGGILRREVECDTPAATAVFADEARELFNVDYALAISNFPKESTPASPGEIHIAFSGREGAKVVSYPYVGHPDILKPRAVKQALNFLRLELLGVTGR